MSIAMTCEIDSSSLESTLAIGVQLGAKLQGGEVLELTSDLGGGKTALVRGLAQGIGSDDQVMSPTFTLNRIYRGEHINLDHYDFYRLHDPGVMRAELTESIAEPGSAVAVEWSEVVADVLPPGRLQIKITVTDESERRFTFIATDETHAELLRGLQ